VFCLTFYKFNQTLIFFYLQLKNHPFWKRFLQRTIYNPLKSFWKKGVPFSEDQFDNRFYS